MIAFILFGLLACASAAPHYHHHHRPAPSPYYDPSPFQDEFRFDDFVDHNMFDMRKFWQELQREMLNIDEILSDVGRRFQVATSNVVREGNNYTITIPLPGYNEKDIVVKAKNGLLVIEAVHNLGNMGQRSYIDMRTLPDDVDSAGKWWYRNEKLNIVFHLTKTDEVSVNTTEAPKESREEIEPREKDVQISDADVRGDFDIDSTTNTSPKQESNVEATTYAVDLNDEFEFVPVQYK